LQNDLLVFFTTGATLAALVEQRFQVGIVEGIATMMSFPFVTIS